MSAHNKTAVPQPQSLGRSPEIPKRVSSVQNVKKRKTSSSGRPISNVTAEQPVKEPTNDRATLQASRERTKGQIEALERRINELESQDVYQELQRVRQQKQVVEAELAEIRAQLSSVVQFLQALAAPAPQGHLPPTQNLETAEPQPAPSEAAHSAYSTADDSPSPASSIPESSVNRQWPLPGNVRTNLRSWSPGDRSEQQREASLSGLNFQQFGGRLGSSFLLDENQRLSASDHAD